MQTASKISSLALALCTTVWVAAVQAQTPAVTQPSAAAKASESAMTRRDFRYLAHLAEANRAEVEISRLAETRAADPRVKEFAKHMVDEHTKALGELNEFAGKKGAQLPSEPDKKHRKLTEKLNGLSGAEFDKVYVNSAAIDAHEDTLKLLKKIINSGHDGDLKEVARRMLPTVEKHLQMAKGLKPAK